MPAEMWGAHEGSHGLSLGREHLSGATWTIPNALSLSRLIVCPAIVVALLRGTPACDAVALGLMCWAVLSDIADGPIARRTRSRSRLGAALDPIADKLLIGSIVVTLVVVRSFPLWAALVIIFRDGCILLASAWLIKARKLVLESTALGKATGAALALMIGAYTLNLHLVSLLLTYLALFFVVVSSVSYLLRLKRLDQRRAV